MKIPQLEKKPELKSCHNVNWEDNYSWVHQYNQNLTVEQENLIDTTNNAKTNDYKETIANITKTVNWNRDYRGF